MYLRRALEDAVAPSDVRYFKELLPTLAYMYSPGCPGYAVYSAAWIRYGYDPMSEPASAIYTALEVRFTDVLVTAALAARAARVAAAAPGGGGVEPPAVRHARGRLADLPLRRNTFIQLADVAVPAVVAAVAAAPRSAAWDDAAGWLPPGLVAGLVAPVKAAARAFAVRELGVPAATALLCARGPAVTVSEDGVVRRVRPPRGRAARGGGAGGGGGAEAAGGGAPSAAPSGVGAGGGAPPPPPLPPPSGWPPGPHPPRRAVRAAVAAPPTAVAMAPTLPLPMT
ncbi:hypothetical protein I4F81_004225 [Pyropia yezoensis]|uniref:Uncharacterized protein n=1 Tax=Pyropia yezoensis TaxID=2788 RepID=A0ACC3BUQ3_PYRYE|nr:hypothetical protein I4F81_004225 [Neopyropia yezoensis]